jgi:hypothetical protein
MSVAERFATLLGRIEPTDDELDTYATHRKTVTARILAVYPDADVQLIGSHYRGSAFQRHSDLDLLVRLRRKDVRWGGATKSSITALNNMRLELGNRFVQTEVGRDQCAVVVNFASGRYSVDVVPAFFEQMKPIAVLGGQRPLLSIPDGFGAWMPTCPEAHNQFIGEADDESRGKLKFVARLLKFWSTCRTPRTPLLNFHVELLLAQMRICTGAKSYACCLAEALLLLRQRQLAGLRDPCGVSNIVPAAKTEPQRRVAFQVVTAAAGWAATAVSAEQDRGLEEAYRLWDRVFNGQFPKR